MLSGQLAAYAEQRPGLDAEGFDAVLTAEPVASSTRRRCRRPGRPRQAAARPATPRARRPVRPAPVDVRRLPGGARELGPRLRDVGAAAPRQAGVDSLWVMDHLRQIPQLGRPWEDMPDAGAVLAHLAAATRRATVGALVHPVSYRDVRLLGRAVATLDVLSGGRAVCGLGAGWYEAEHHALGLPFPPARERLDALEDALQFLPLLWGKGSPAFAGRGLDVPEAMSYPRPLQEHVPILVGGPGPAAPCGLSPGTPTPAASPGARTPSARRWPCCGVTARTPTATREESRSRTSRRSASCLTVPGPGPRRRPGGECVS